MKNIFLFLFLLFSLTLFGQAPSDSIGKKIRIGFGFSPDFNSSIFKINADPFIKKYNKERSSGSFGMTADANINIAIKKNVEFETGLQYSIKGSKYKRKYEDYPSEELIIDSPETFEPQVVPYNYINTTNNHFLDIPVKFYFLSKGNKVRFIGSLGFDTNFYLFSSSRARFEALIDGFEDYTHRSLDGGDSFIDITPTVSMGVDCMINEKVNLRIEPTFRYSLGVKHSSPSRFFSLGLNTKFYFDFWN